MAIEMKNDLYGSNDINIYRLFETNKIKIENYSISDEDYFLNSYINERYINYFPLFKLPTREHNLSKSEETILKILIALSKDAEVYIVTDIKYLDANNTKYLIKLLKDLSYTKSIIIISDDYDLIFENCNKVFLFMNRKLRYFGDVKKVFSSPRFLKDQDFSKPSLIKIKFMAKEKGINLFLRRDYKDLIKDIYKNVK